MSTSVHYRFMHIFVSRGLYVYMECIWCKIAGSKSAIQLSQASLLLNNKEAETRKLFFAHDLLFQARNHCWGPDPILAAVKNILFRICILCECACPLYWNCIKSEWIAHKWISLESKNRMLTLALNAVCLAQVTATRARGFWKRKTNKPGKRKSKQAKTTATTTIVQQFFCLRETLAFCFKKRDVWQKHQNAIIWECTSRWICVDVDLSIQLWSIEIRCNMYAFALGQLLNWDAHIILSSCFCEEKSCPVCSNMLPLSALPRNILERVACTLIVLTAGLCWAYVLGEVCAIVSDAWPEVWRERAWTTISCRCF